MRSNIFQKSSRLINDAKLCTSHSVSEFWPFAFILCQDGSITLVGLVNSSLLSSLNSPNLWHHAHVSSLPLSAPRKYQHFFLLPTSMLHYNYLLFCPSRMMAETFFVCLVFLCGAQLMLIELTANRLLKIICYLFFNIFNISLPHLTLIFKWSSLLKYKTYLCIINALFCFFSND